jgi:hypothetical protein
MIAEALVIFACVNSTGCTETSNQYFYEHPTLKHNLDNDAKELREYIGPQFVDTVGPVLFVFAGGTGTVHLHDHLDLRVKKDSAILSFSWTLR